MKTNGGVLLFRLEVRVDRSNVSFFTKGDAPASTQTQVTVGAGAA